MYIYQTMSNNFGYIDIILLAMIAGFIILRLRNILGRKTGHEEKIVGSFAETKFGQFKKKTNDEKIKEEGLVGEQKKEFLIGAEIAYETILTAFSKGDKKKLKDLLSPEMASNFEQAIIQRNKDKISSELTFIGIKSSNLEKFERIKTEFFAIVLSKDCSAIRFMKGCRARENIITVGTITKGTYANGPPIK